MKAFRYGMAAGPADAAAVAPSAEADAHILALQPDLAASDACNASDLAAEPDLARPGTGLPARLPNASRAAVAPRTGLQDGSSNIRSFQKGGLFALLLTTDTLIRH